jgi:hypothetical protein
MKHRPILPVTLVVALFFFAATTPAAETVTAEHARVTYDGVDARSATAIANTIAAAWTAYVEDFAFDMPQTVIGSVEVGPGKQTRLYTDGHDHLFLTLPSQRQLAPPSKSGVFNLYGMCHELGHMAMYRTLTEVPFLSGAANEGWAHYVGSCVVDRVYESKGETLWPEKYDYHADGTARLDKQLTGLDVIDPTVRAAGAWRKLEPIIGRKGFVKLFEQWKKDQPTEPAEVLASAVAAFPDKRQPLTEWWSGSGSKFLMEPPALPSAQKQVTIELAKLAGQPVELKTDDGGSDGKRSIGGGGHARKFVPPDTREWLITTVSVYGGRYGPAKAPATKFDLVLCDEQMRPIATWKRPFASFPYGGMDWVKFEVRPPTRVPPGAFYICLDFHPTATNGVYVGFDSSTKGDSQVATPGKPGQPMDQGDWMIRVELDRRADERALEEP